MPKVILIQQVFNSRKWMELVYPAMVNQTYKDIEIIAQIVIDDGGCKEYIQKNFPQIKILEPGYNIGFARGHNEIFASTNAEYYQLVNPDLVMEPTYVEEMVKAMEAEPRAGAATGKLLRYDFEHKQKTNIFDTTGIVMSTNGRARDRGQHEEDRGQYDKATAVIGVSGAGPMYRKTALEEIKYKREDDGRFEYFDEDFHSYWEDTDLSLRLQSMSWTSVFVPKAIAYHGRTAASTKKGYKDVVGFVRHHKKFSVNVLQLNYKNHIFVVLKNMPRISWKFFFREWGMLGYVTLFRWSIFKIIPELIRQLPLMLKKRRWIKAHRKTTDWVKLLNNKGLWA
jgi:GT2 family glycosyltransferase